MTDGFETPDQPAPEDTATARGAALLGHIDDGPTGPSLDPAQQSLASALNLTFRIVQFVMVLVAGAFLLSGVQTVGESERGIKLSFGALSATDVQPGIRWNWPYPFGEIVRVRTSQETFDLRDSFMPLLPVVERTKPWSQVLTQKPRLKPGEDGSVVTADGAIAHLELAVRYSRSDPVANAQNVYAPDEERIIRAAVERGAVAAAAETPIDRMLRQAGDGGPATGSLESRIRRAAQEVLDSIGAGILIESVSVRDPRPPLFVAKEFDAVSRAEADAAKAREDAERLARLILNESAGEAHDVILARIDAFERAIELRDEALADRILAQIDAILVGETVEIDGEIVEVPISGEVTSTINDARRYRTDVVARARSRAEMFQAKLAQFRADPGVLVASDWSAAYRAFLEDGVFETMILPAGAAGEFLLTPDPAIPKKLEAERNRKQAEQTVEQRTNFIQQRFNERMERESRERAQQRAGGGS